MKIERKDVEHVARLARLALQPAELQQMTEQMDAILAYVDKLNELDTAGIEPTSHAVPMENAFREDEIKTSLEPERTMQNAPATSDGCFQVPRVIE